MNITRSTSGAYIVRLGDHVIKLGDGDVGERIRAQATWLTTYAGSGIIPVTPIDNLPAYIMPHCEQWADGADAHNIFSEVTQLLYEHVWDHPPRERDMSPGDHIFNKIARRGQSLKSNRLWLRLMTLWGTVDWDLAPKCLVHGDPTFCNTMWMGHETIEQTRVIDRLVLCDPLPDRPDIRAIDLGKLLQSCYGFETLVHGWRYSVPPNPAWVRDLCTDDNEWSAARVCALLHIVQLLPYVSGEFHEEFIRIFHEISDDM